MMRSRMMLKRVGLKRTTLPYCNCGVKPFAYGTVEKNRASGLCIKLFNDTNKVTADVVLEREWGVRG